MIAKQFRHTREQQLAAEFHHDQSPILSILIEFHADDGHCSIDCVFQHKFGAVESLFGESILAHTHKIVQSIR